MTPKPSEANDPLSPGNAAADETQTAADSGQTAAEDQATGAAARPSGPQAAVGTGADVQAADLPEDVRAELQAARNGALKAHAELENFRKRMRREMEDERKYAALPLVGDLLPVLDNLRRAIEAAEHHQDSQGLLAGVKMVAEQLGSVLLQHHCREIAARGEAFDPHVHEALAQQPAPDVPPGTVVDVHRPGYKLHDRVVRPAQVLVSKQPD